MKAQEFIKEKGYWFPGDGLISLLMEQYSKQELTNFLDFLLKGGYCDSDVYDEPPTAVDQYLAK